MIPRPSWADHLGRRHDLSHQVKLCSTLVWWDTPRHWRILRTVGRFWCWLFPWWGIMWVGSIAIKFNAYDDQDVFVMVIFTTALIQSPFLCFFLSYRGSPLPPKPMTTACRPTLNLEIFILQASSCLLIHGSIPIGRLARVWVSGWLINKFLVSMVLIPGLWPKRLGSLEPCWEILLW